MLLLLPLSDSGILLRLAFFHLLLQALFRKIAAALPGMEALSATKQQEDLVDVQLTSQKASAPDKAATSCAC